MNESKNEYVIWMNMNSKNVECPKEAWKQRTRELRSHFLCHVFCLIFHYTFTFSPFFSQLYEVTLWSELWEYTEGSFGFQWLVLKPHWVLKPKIFVLKEVKWEIWRERKIMNWKFQQKENDFISIKLRWEERKTRTLMNRSHSWKWKLGRKEFLCLNITFSWDPFPSS